MHLEVSAKKNAPPATRAWRRQGPEPAVVDFGCVWAGLGGRRFDVPLSNAIAYAFRSDLWRMEFRNAPVFRVF